MQHPLVVPEDGLTSPGSTAGLAAEIGAANASAPEFFRTVYRLVAQIPRGRVSTYGDVARAAGKPGAARAVGNAMNRNRDCARVP